MWEWHDAVADTFALRPHFDPGEEDSQRHNSGTTASKIRVGSILTQRNTPRGANDELSDTLPGLYNFPEAGEVLLDF